MPRLDFVQPEQRSVRGGDVACCGQVAGRRDENARFALYRFEDHRGRLVGDGGGQCGRVAVRDEGDVTGQRFEGLPVGRLAGERERAERPAVERRDRGDQMRAAGPTGCLERRLVGLGAGVREEHPAAGLPSR